MKKLKLALDELQVETFQPVREQPGLRGTVHGNSGCCYPDEPNYTQYWSTCQQTGGGETCDNCQSGNGCLTGDPINTYEESFCQCSAEYSCDCAFSEASNCHRCTGP